LIKVCYIYGDIKYHNGFGNLGLTSDLDLVVLAVGEGQKPGVKRSKST
jgi:hypothetical protein